MDIYISENRFQEIVKCLHRCKQSIFGAKAKTRIEVISTKGLMKCRYLAPKRKSGVRRCLESTHEVHYKILVTWLLSIAQPLSMSCAISRIVFSLTSRIEKEDSEKGNWNFVAVAHLCEEKLWKNSNLFKGIFLANEFSFSQEGAYSSKMARFGVLTMVKLSFIIRTVG